jgi:hypothetical protein
MVSIVCCIINTQVLTVCSSYEQLLDAVDQIIDTSQYLNDMLFEADNDVCSFCPLYSLLLTIV